MYANYYRPTQEEKTLLKSWSNEDQRLLGKETILPIIFKSELIRQIREKEILILLRKPWIDSGRFCVSDQNFAISIAALSANSNPKINPSIGNQILDLRIGNSTEKTGIQPRNPSQESSR